MTGVDAGVNLYAGRTNEGRFFLQKKPRIASFVSGVSSIPAVNEDEDTGRGILISHPAGDNGASHKTDFSLSDAVVPVNCSRRFEYPGTSGSLGSGLIIRCRIPGIFPYS